IAMAGEARSPAKCSDQKLNPKCSTPLHSATAISRGHCPAGGGLTNHTSTSARIDKRTAVNRNGGISRSANAEVRKLQAHATQITSTRARSRPRRPPPCALALMAMSPRDAQLAQPLGHHPCRTDQQIGQVGEEAGLAPFVLVADELRDPRDDEHADRQRKQGARTEG